METREYFRSIMAERRQHRAGTLDHEYRTRAARKLAWLMRGVPVAEWVE